MGKFENLRDTIYILCTMYCVQINRIVIHSHLSSGARTRYDKNHYPHSFFKSLFCSYESYLKILRVSTQVHTQAHIVRLYYIVRVFMTCPTSPMIYTTGKKAVIISPTSTFTLKLRIHWKSCQIFNRNNNTFNFLPIITFCDVIYIQFLSISTYDELCKM